MSKTHLLIDGNAIIHRAYHALPDTFQTKDGTPTNAVHGFFSMLYKVVSDFQPTYLTVCFDSPKPSFRKELFKEYQAQRPKTPDSFKLQFPLVKNLLELGGVDQVEKETYEADDIIGSLAHQYANPELMTLILTGDKDIFQLVDTNTHVISPKTGLSSITVYDEETVLTKMGVPPGQIPDFKALAGDPSDNYQAAKGIGPKTAIKLLEQFGTVEGMYDRIDQVQEERIKNILVNDKKNVLLMKQIATIVTDLDVPLNLQKETFSGFDENMKDEMERLELNSLVKRFFESNGKKKGQDEKKEEKKKEEAEDTSQLGLF